MQTAVMSILGFPSDMIGMGLREVWEVMRHPWGML